MWFTQVVPHLLLLAAYGCGQRSPSQQRFELGAEVVAPRPLVRGANGLPVEASWPSRERFAETAARLPRPWTLVKVRHGDKTLVAAARREGSTWILGRLHGLSYDTPRPAGCESFPCPWPSTLVPEKPLREQSPLPGELLAAVAYARTLVAFEGPLRLAPEGEWHRGEALPEGLPPRGLGAATPAEASDLRQYLERLRQVYPAGRCSMDTRPQRVAMMRATAAAQAGRTGWAVRGWVETVGYWASERVAWSSFGQHHPEGHLELLRMVGVDPARLVLGLLLSLPGHEPELALGDVLRIAPDLGESFAADLRRLAASPAVDPLNRALMFAVVARLPLTDDPLYAQLPAESQALLDLWSR